jgi:hypothetical protein
MDMGQDWWTCPLGLHSVSSQRPQIVCINGLLPCPLGQNQGDFVWGPSNPTTII